MGEIVLDTSARMSDAINQLRTLNSQFRKKAEEINAEQTKLTTYWEGDASTAFQEHFRKEYPNFETFATVIDQYIEALTQIRDEYDRTEDMNKAIASD